MRHLPYGLRYAALAMATAWMIAGVLAVVVALLARVAPLTIAVVVALLAAALVTPITDRLRRRRVPAGLSALAGVLSLLLAASLPMTLIGTRVVAEFPSLRRQLGEGLLRVRELLRTGPIPVSDRQLDAMAAGLARAGRAAAPDPLGGASAAAQALASLLLTVVVLFFLLKDGEMIWRWTARRLPERIRSRADAAAEAGWRTLVSYIRGTVLVALIDALGIGIALVLIGVPLALPLALLTFVGGFIPIVGATVAGAAAVLVAFVTGGLLDALLVLLAVLVVQQAEGNLLQPLIMGRTLRLHPLVVLVVVSAGTLLAGIVGAAIAVPVAAVGYRAVRAWRGTPPGGTSAPPASPEDTPSDDAGPEETPPGDTAPRDTGPGTPGPGDTGPRDTGPGGTPPRDGGHRGTAPGGRGLAGAGSEDAAPPRGGDPADGRPGADAHSAATRASAGSSSAATLRSASSGRSSVRGSRASAAIS